MSRAGTKSVQRKISQSDLQSPEYLNAPAAAKPTAMGLWVIATDSEGRCECQPQILAGLIYPGEAATEMVIEHLLMLEESGFLDLYEVGGLQLIALRHPLRPGDPRSAASEHPSPPPRGAPWNSTAVGGARERAGVRASERVLAEGAERASRWATWEAEQESVRRLPERPLLMDAPPIGCPDHPSGRYADCGPCGTARRRHDLWVSQQRYATRVESYEQGRDDDEPF